MKARTLIAAFALPLAASLWLAEPAQAGGSVRLELLSEAGSSQAGFTHDGDRHKTGSHRGHGRHGHDGHRGPEYQRHGYGRQGYERQGYERHGGYGHGNFIRERAHHYATMAIRQAEEARALGYYDDHPRWRLGYHRHFQWALQASPHRIDEEIRQRAHKLRELRSWGPYGPGWNDHRHGPHCSH